MSANPSIPSGLIPNWVGFGLAIAASIAALVVGIIQPYAGLIAIGIAGLASSIIAWVYGTKKTSPNVNPFKKDFGATLKEIEMLPSLIIIGLIAAAIIIAVATA